MVGHDIIVIGASAGGVEALIHVVAELPADLNAAVFVVVHTAPHSPSLLPNILARKGALPAIQPRDGEPIHKGKIYVAPADQHLLLRDSTIRLSRGPRENGHRPAVDPLFRTAALYHGPRTIGVVLSGTLDDGTAGLAEIKHHGGVAVVHNPADALYPGMPTSALDHVEVDHVATSKEIGPLLARLVQIPAKLQDPTSESAQKATQMESDMAAFDLNAIEDPTHPGHPSAFGCPDCGGTLWELDDDDPIHFRCRVGHAWTAGSLLTEQAEALETALWTALRALEESAALGRRLARRFEQKGHHGQKDRFQQRAAEARQQAELIRQLLVTLRPAPLEESEVSRSTDPTTGSPAQD